GRTAGTKACPITERPAQPRAAESRRRPYRLPFPSYAPSRVKVIALPARRGRWLGLAPVETPGATATVAAGRHSGPSRGFALVDCLGGGRTPGRGEGPPDWLAGDGRT